MLLPREYRKGTLTQSDVISNVEKPNNISKGQDTEEIIKHEKSTSFKCSCQLNFQKYKILETYWRSPVTFSNESVYAEFTDQ